MGRGSEKTDWAVGSPSTLGEREESKKEGGQKEGDKTWGRQNRKDNMG